jgi:hypothetical protein
VHADVLAKLVNLWPAARLDELAELVRDLIDFEGRTESQSMSPGVIGQ